MSNRLMTEATRALQRIRIQRDFQIKRLSELNRYKDHSLIPSCGYGKQIYYYAK